MEFFGIDLPVPEDDDPVTKQIISSLNVPLNTAERMVVNKLFKREMERLSDERDESLKLESAVGTQLN